MQDNPSELPSDKKCVLISTLVNSSKITEENSYNPKTGRQLEGGVKVIKNDDNSYQYIYSEDCGKSITVTFDYNGGSGSTQSKTVTYYDNYGDLPTPNARSNFEFVGWNGKNMLNLNVNKVDPDNKFNLLSNAKREFTSNTYVIGLSDDNSVSLVTPGSDDVGIIDNTISLKTKLKYGIAFPLKSSADKSYTLYYDALKTSGSGVSISSIMYYKQDGTFISDIYIYTEGEGHKEIQFITPDDTFYLVLNFAATGGGLSGLTSTDVQFSKIQLEEGSVATDYEPYKIISTTQVVQNKNHTLKAIWK